MRHNVVKGTLLAVLLVGSGADAGQIRIRGVKDDSGIEPKQLMHAFVFRFGFVPRLGEDSFEDRRPVRKIGDDLFEIDGSPSWFDDVPQRSAM